MRRNDNVETIIDVERDYVAHIDWEKRWKIGDWPVDFEKVSEHQHMQCESFLCK